MNDKRIKRSATTFPDANLEVAIRKAINKPEGPIYASDLEPLTELDLLGNNISDISSLISLTNLRELWLAENSISDISALAGLFNLHTLDLADNNISDISPLVENSNLSVDDIVYLMGNPLSPTSIGIYIPQLEARGVYVAY